MTTPPSVFRHGALLSLRALLILAVLAFALSQVDVLFAVQPDASLSTPLLSSHFQPALPGKPDGATPHGIASSSLSVDPAYRRSERPGPAAPSLPTRFDWRETGKVSPVKDQGTCGACTSFATVAAFESRLLIDGAGLWDFSENNAKECDWYQSGCAAGSILKVFSFFAQKGAVLESCDPYVPGDVACKSSCPYQKSVLEWRYWGNSVADTIFLKYALMTYGPIMAGLYTGNGDAWDQEFSNYDGSYTLYYNGAQPTDHAVLIVGWDDNLTHAGGKGGWIVKNSWGTGWGGPCGYGSQGGFFTIAYGSASIGMDASAPIFWQDYDPQGSVWYYDEGGANGSWGYNNPTAWELAKFIPPSDTYVTRVEFWTNDYVSDLDIYLYDGFDGQNLSGLLASKLNLGVPSGGFFSVALNSPVHVTAGNDVIAVIQVTNSTKLTPIAVDFRGPHETGRTYVSPDGVTWEDLGPNSVDGTIRLRTTPNPPLPETKPIYLPLVARLNPPPPPTQGINGLVTYNGAPADGIGLRLRFYNGSGWSDAATTTTAADGRYAFQGVPGLAAGQGYYVLFGPNTSNSSYLYSWAGPTITSYIAGAAQPGGDFDIADVKLLSPPNRSALTVPVTFTWQRRGLPGDTYRVVLFDPQGPGGWLTNDLGDVGSVTLTGLASGMVYGKEYGWFPRVYKGPESYGSSLYYRLITFNSSQAMDPSVTPAGAEPLGGVPVSLHRGAQVDAGLWDPRMSDPPGARQGSQAP
jgi:C1A family cysteine protease